MAPPAAARRGASVTHAAPASAHDRARLLRGAAGPIAAAPLARRAAPRARRGRSARSRERDPRSVVGALERRRQPRVRLPRAQQVARAADQRVAVAPVERRAVEQLAIAVELQLEQQLAEPVGARAQVRERAVDVRELGHQSR